MESNGGPLIHYGSGNGAVSDLAIGISGVSPAQQFYSTSILIDNDGSIGYTPYELPGFHPGEWHHLAYVWDGVSHRAYLDAQLIMDRASTRIPRFVGNEFQVGSNIQDNNFFVGSFDELRLHNRVLNPEELASGYFVPPPPCPADTNADNIVNGADLSFFLGVFGTTVANFPAAQPADFNADGVVNGLDLSVFLANFGNTCGN